MSELYELLTPDFTFQDERGELAQLVHTGYEQVNVLVSRAGTKKSALPKCGLHTRGGLPSRG